MTQMILLLPLSALSFLSPVLVSSLCGVLFFQHNIVNSIGTAIRDTAKEVLDKPKIKRQPWVPDDVLKLCDQRRELEKKTTNEEAHKQYRELNKDIIKRMRKSKNDLKNERYTEIETEMKGNNTRQAYSILKALTKKGQADRQTSKIKKTPSLPKKAVLGRWTE